jgi:predicted lipoprotein
MNKIFFRYDENKFFNLNIYSVMVLTVLMLTSCTFATVRSLDEDEEAKAGFNAADYVDGIWESQIIPTIQENAIDINELLTLIDTSEETAIEQYGARSGTGSYSFMVRGEAQVLSLNTDSRIGSMTIDLAPFDGTPDAEMAIGPVIRNRNNAVRDAVGFIQFNDFVNQTEFADVSTAIKDRILQDVITPLDLESLIGKTIYFYGAFTLDNRDDLEIIPISIEVQE